MRVAVVGHVEWAEFVRVDRMPQPGEIVHAHAWWQAAAGGGAVAAVALARLAGEALFLTALGDDALGHRAVSELAALGVRVAAAFRPEPQRRAVVHVDDTGERTITVIGPRLVPRRADALPWAELAACDAVYVTAGNAGASHAARAARVLTATPRTREPLAAADVRLDALVGSARDAGEAYRSGELHPEPALVVRTEGGDGGSWAASGGESGRWQSVHPPAAVVDTYGAGDTFAAALTYGLGAEWPLERALALAARCAATALTGRAPYGAALAAEERSGS